MIKNGINEVGTRKTISFLIQMIVVSVSVGCAGGLIVYGFCFALDHMVEFLSKSDKWLLYLLPLIGATLTAVCCYTTVPGSRGDGTSSYIVSVNTRMGQSSAVTTLVKPIATLLTLGFGCTGGIVGPLGRICAGAGSLIGNVLIKIGFSPEQRRTATICGMAAAVGGVFMSPLGGGIFSVEVLRRGSMRYSDIFPAILSSISSYLVLSSFQFQSFYVVDAPSLGMKASLFGPVIVTVAVTVMMGYLFLRLFDSTGKIFEATNFSWPVKGIIGGAIVVVLGLIFSTRVLGIGTELFKQMFSGQFGSMHTGAGLLVIFLALGRIIATSAAIGSGLSAGLTGPCVIVGTMIGCAMADFTGHGPSTAYFFALTAASIAAMMSGVLNVPIAAIVIITDIFGAEYAAVAAFASVIAFKVLKAKTIYAYSIEHIQGLKQDSMGENIE
jgi:chloride channel protein, CIC family